MPRDKQIWQSCYQHIPSLPQQNNLVLPPMHVITTGYDASHADNVKVPANCLGSNNYRWTQTERILAKDASKATNLHDLDKKVHNDLDMTLL